MKNKMSKMFFLGLFAIVNPASAATEEPMAEDCISMLHLNFDQAEVSTKNPFSKKIEVKVEVDSTTGKKYSFVVGFDGMWLLNNKFTKTAVSSHEIRDILEKKYDEAVAMAEERRSAYFVGIQAQNYKYLFNYMPIHNPFVREMPVWKKK